MNIHFITLIGLTLILIGTALTIIGQQIINDKSTKEAKILWDKNIQLSDKNIQLSEELKNFVTSGDSFCYIQPMPDEISDRQTLMLFHEGNYPLYDVNVNIQNQELMETLPLKERYDEIVKSHKQDDARGKKRERDLLWEMESFMDSARKNFILGTLSPKTAITLDRLPLSKTGHQEFFIKIHTRNAYFFQTIVQKRIGQSWETSWRLVKPQAQGNGIIIKELINPEIPIK